LREGRYPEAIRLAEQALEAFADCGTAYDVAQVQLSLAGMHAACGHVRQAVELAAAARSQVEAKGFGRLARLYPQLRVPIRDSIAAAISAYACGDALGVPWEGRPPTEIDLRAAAELPTPPDWAPGATSDDTALTLLVAAHLGQHSPPVPEAFLVELSAQAEQIAGLGPSTQAAIVHFRATGRLPEPRWEHQRRSDARTSGRLGHRTARCRSAPAVGHRPVSLHSSGRRGMQRSCHRGRVRKLGDRGRPTGTSCGCRGRRAAATTATTEADPVDRAPVVGGETQGRVSGRAGRRSSHLWLSGRYEA
jgi:hypothetical protein